MVISIVIRGRINQEEALIIHAANELLQVWNACCQTVSSRTKVLIIKFLLSVKEFRHYKLTVITLILAGLIIADGRTLHSKGWKLWITTVLLDGMFYTVCS